MYIKTCTHAHTQQEQDTPLCHEISSELLFCISYHLPLSIVGKKKIKILTSWQMYHKPLGLKALLKTVL